MTATLEARFLAVISHELRTPLTTIASFAESLDTDDLAPGERSLALSAVRRNTERMLAEAIATRHGGSIELRFEAGTGAGAEIRLPLTIPSG